MEFKNDTQENIKYRLGTTATGYYWQTARPGEVVDIPEGVGESTLLVKHGKATTDKSDAGQSNQEKAVQLYKKTLVAIAGLGTATANKIMQLYPTKDKLKKALSEGKEVPVKEEIREELEKL